MQPSMQLAALGQWRFVCPVDRPATGFTSHKVH
jgi:hypothetical protein